jgi:hypothetical protein
VVSVHRALVVAAVACADSTPAPMPALGLDETRAGTGTYCHGSAPSRECRLGWFALTMNR